MATGDQSSVIERHDPRGNEYDARRRPNRPDDPGMARNARRHGPARYQLSSTRGGRSALAFRSIDRHEDRVARTVAG
jgi:hypothetical protein